MPDQKVPFHNDRVLTEQVFSGDRNARIASTALEEGAKVADIAAKAALEAKKKRKRIAEAFEAKKKQDRENKKQKKQQDLNLLEETAVSTHLNLLDKVHILGLILRPRIS